MTQQPAPRRLLFTSASGHSTKTAPNRAPGPCRAPRCSHHRGKPTPLLLRQHPKHGASATESEALQLHKATECTQQMLLKPIFI